MFKPLLRAAAILIAAAFCCASFAAESVIRWTDTYVEVEGIDASSLTKSNLTTRDWQLIFSVHAEQSDLLSDMNLPAIHGVYKIFTDGLRFEPKFPFEPEITYRAIFRPANLPNGAGATVISKHRLLAPERKAIAEVAAIYPSADRLPENLLKFYLHFTDSMSGGHIYDYIELRDLGTGKRVELPFLEIDEELWDRDMRRLTLFLDPGRIKRGVKPLEDIGPSFHPGKTYTLTISSNWLDAAGAPLKKSFAKTFAVTPADREPPDPAHWTIKPPRAGTTNALALRFNESLDQALAIRTITVAVAGHATLDDHETRWLYHPDKPWQPGVYEIQIPTLIEDLAGNNIGKPFDVDTSKDKRARTNAIVKKPFTVR